MKGRRVRVDLAGDKGIPFLNFLCFFSCRGLFAKLYSRVINGSFDLTQLPKWFAGGVSLCAHVLKALAVAKKNVESSASLLAEVAAVKENVVNMELHN